MFEIWLAALGLAVGSFLNVVIARLPNDESIVRPRSRCPKCGHSLPWHENIPVLSWLFLRGKCSACKAPISVRYPLIELLTAFLFLASWRRFDWSYELAPALMLVALLIPLVFIDAEHWILPLELTVPGIAVGIAMAIPMGLDRLKGAVLGAAIGFLVMRAMEFLGWLAFRKEALGAGDKFLYALIGAFLTYQALLGVIFFASVQGSVVGLIRLKLTGRAGPAQEAGPREEEEEKALTMTWEFLKPGLSLGRRLLLFPYCVLLQPIPDEPKDDSGQEVEWTPGASNLPFGPWIALGGLEILLFGQLLSERVPLPGVGWIFWGPM